MAAAPPGQGRLRQADVHHVGGQHRVGAGAAEVDGDDLGQVPDDAFGIEKPQGQFLLPARQAHQHLKRFASQANLQGFFHDHHVLGGFYLALPVAPDGEFFDGLSHGQGLEISINDHSQFGFICRPQMILEDGYKLMGLINLSGHSAG